MNNLHKNTSFFFERFNAIHMLSEPPTVHNEAIEVINPSTQSVVILGFREILVEYVNITRR